MPKDGQADQDLIRSIAELLNEQNLAEIEIAYPVEDLPRVHEADRAKATKHRHAQLGVEDEDGITSRREVVGADGLERNAKAIQCISTHRRVAAGEEPLAAGHVRYHLSDGFAVGPQNRFVVGVEDLCVVGKPLGET